MFNAQGVDLLPANEFNYLAQGDTKGHYLLCLPDSIANDHLREWSKSHITREQKVTFFFNFDKTLKQMTRAPNNLV